METPRSSVESVDFTGKPSATTLLRLWRAPLVLPLAAFLVSLAAALRTAMRYTDGHLIYALDDAYIHMAVAKNFASHGVWGCTPFHFSSSSSSLLWTFVLGIAYRAFGVRDVTPLILNIAFAVGTLAVANRYLTRFGTPPILRAATLLGLVVALPMTGMVLMGMEHILHLLLTIWFAAAAVEALTSPPEDARLRRGRTIRLCILGALLGASRYEGFFLIGLACLCFLARRQLLRGLSIGAAALFPVVAFGALSVANGGFFLPNSLMLKAAGESVSVVSAFFKPFGSEDLAFLQNNHAMPILLVIGVLCALGQWYSHRDVWRPQVLLPLLLAAMVVAHGHYVFSPMYWVYRYDAYLVGFGIFVTAIVLAVERVPGGLAQPRFAAALVILLTGLVADVRDGFTAASEIAGMRNTYLEQYQTALFIRNYYAGETVIVNDLGAVTYYSDARILDLAALGDVEPLQIMRRTGNYTSRDVLAWTTQYRPAIAIISLGWSWVAPLVPREWIKIGEVEVPPNRERVGFYAINPNACWMLRSSMTEQFWPLHRVLGYQLRVRSPEKMYEVIAAASKEPRSPQ